MPILSIIWSLIKVFGPYLVIALVCIFIGSHWYDKGYNKADRIRIEQMAKINAAIAEADKRVEEKDLEIANLSKHIQETSNANRKIIESLSYPNISLLNNRLRRETADCRSNNSVSKTSSNSSSGSGARAARARTFLEDSGLGIVESAKQCDIYIESLRSCRQYAVKALEIINQCDKVVINGNSNSNN